MTPMHRSTIALTILTPAAIAPAGYPALTAGIDNLIVVPPPEAAVAMIVPPWASTSRFAIDSPRPVPPVSAAVTNRSKTKGS